MRCGTHWGMDTLPSADARHHLPEPDDGSPVVVVAIADIDIAWIGPPPGSPGDGDLVGDGSATAAEIIAQIRALWASPVEADHPSWRRPAWTIPGDPRGVIATLLHVGGGRSLLRQAPDDAVEDLFQEPDEEDGGDGDGRAS